MQKVFSAIFILVVGFVLGGLAAYFYLKSQPMTQDQLREALYKQTDPLGTKTCSQLEIDRLVAKCTGSTWVEPLVPGDYKKGK